MPAAVELGNRLDGFYLCYIVSDRNVSAAVRLAGGGSPAGCLKQPMPSVPTRWDCVQLQSIEFCRLLRRTPDPTSKKIV